MPDLALLSLVAGRLAAAPPPDGSAGLVVAALQGDAALGRALDGEPAAAAAYTAQPLPPAALYLSSMEVEGFRGIGPATTLTVAPGPGLTLIMGRNGSGKSSFSEALEMLLLGTNRRWAGRPKVWLEGWQNLHHRHTRITARFAVDGRRGPLELTRRWADGAAIEDSTLLIDGRPGSLDRLGWTQPLASFPPLLSHNELEHTLDEGPSKLYDALAGILGLGELAHAQHALRDRRLELERAVKQAQGAVQPLRAILEACADERAVKALAALAGRSWDLAAVEAVVSGSAAADERSTLMRLRDLAALPALDSARISAVVGELRTAHEDLERRSASDSGRALATALLLEQALAVHAHAEDETCAVCGTQSVLTYAWRVRARERVTELTAAAAEMQAAQARVAEASRQARQLVTAPPNALRDRGDHGIDTAAVTEQWQLWARLPAGDDPLRLASHLEVHGQPLVAAIAAVRKAATAELERRESSWRPAAQAIVEWLPLGRLATTATERTQHIRDAEQWLRDAHDEVRDERFRPIAQSVQANWTALRQDSSVNLGELRLEGASGQRRLKLDVTVGDQPGSALGVMSQGELNCLALSLFLPRASMAESPFHFVVVDDPVQAMDPAKVEGLATLLAGAAESRQVIVLTHDDRLADAVRFLQIDATVIEVARREQSVVDVRPIRDPVQRYIEDAFAVASTEGLPPEAVRVVPGFCRMALEAAASISVTRRMLREGRRYAEVHSALQRPTTLNMWLALALLKDAGRSGDVAAHLEKQAPWALEAVRECNRGAHGGQLTRDLVGFIRAVERLAALMLERA